MSQLLQFLMFCTAETLIMATRNPVGGVPPNVTTRTASQVQTPNTSRTQEGLPEPQFDHDLDDDLEGVDVAQLREQKHTLARDRDMLGQILAQLSELNCLSDGPNATPRIRPFH